MPEKSVCINGKFSSEELKIIKYYLTDNRLEKYKELAKKYKKRGKYKELLLYKGNMRLSKNLYELCHYFEIFLRNAIDNKMSEVYGCEWIYNFNWTIKDKEKIDSIRKNISERKGHCDKNDIIAGMDFGFWTNMFHGKYEQSIWKNALSKIFPKKTNREIGAYKIFNEIRLMRNRISHHEIIVKNNDWFIVIMEVCHIINNINPVLLKWIESETSFFEYISRLPNYQENRKDFIGV